MPPSWAPPDINIMPGESCGRDSTSVKTTIQEIHAATVPQQHVQTVNININKRESQLFANVCPPPLFYEYEFSPLTLLIRFKYFD